MFDDLFDANFMGLPLPDRYELVEHQPGACSFYNFGRRGLICPCVRDKETGTLCTWRDHEREWNKKKMEIELTNGEKYLIPYRWWLCAKNKGPFDVSRIAMEKALKYYYLDYCRSTYLVLECLGCDHIIKDGYEYTGPPKCVTVIDHDRPIALPRKMYRASSVLQDDDLMQINVMPIPFTKRALSKAVDLVFESKWKTDMEGVRVLDFLGCLRFFPEPKNVTLTESDWDQVLTMTPCVEQLMSGFTLIEGVLSSGDLKLYIDDEGDVVCDRPTSNQTLRHLPPLPERIRDKVHYIYRGDLRFTKNDSHALYGVQGRYNPETKILKYRIASCYSCYIFIEGQCKRLECPARSYGSGYMKFKERNGHHRLPKTRIPPCHQNETRGMVIIGTNEAQAYYSDSYLRDDYFGVVFVRNDYNRFPNARVVYCVKPYHDWSVYAGMTLTLEYQDPYGWMYVFAR